MNIRMKRLLRESQCEIRTDTLIRQLYATDASIHQIVPEAVALPKTAQEAASVLRAAADQAIQVTPRGAGTGLCGGAIGPGLVMDFARYNRQITEFNPEARTVRVGAGVVLDQLNAFLQPHGLTFGPDVATSSRATLGGMIASNSSGARAPVYGVTIDHVRSVEVVLTDGRVLELGLEKTGFEDCRTEIDQLIMAHADEIRERFHDGICKRWGGYALDRYLRAPGDLSKLIGGSEGTLAGIFSAELNLVPSVAIKEKGLGLIFFASVDEAMQAMAPLLALKPAAVEHIDDVLFNQTRGQLLFEPARALLDLDAHPCKAILIVEFYNDVQDKLAALETLHLGLRHYICKNAAEMATVWNLRKAGLSLLTGCAGPAKPTAGVEDSAIPPEHLADYVTGMRAILNPLGLVASYYGHAASGLLHIRPVVDLHKAEDIAKFRIVGEEVSKLVRQFRGSFTAEHGVGVSHTEFMEEHIGPELLGVMRRIKDLFDPKNVMNPSKIFDDGRYAFDGDLRQGAEHALQLPFEPVLAFAAKDKSFIGNLEQCNGCGGCRKDAPTMCPTFIATGEEIMSTRGRANTIRAVLEQRIDRGVQPILTPELDEAIRYCLSCKACASECPSNVNMALLKAELLYARMRTNGVPLSTRVISRVDLLGELASKMPRIANASLKWAWLRLFMEKSLGLTRRRPLPPYALQRFDTWFKQRRPKSSSETAGRVILWDDCFVRYNEPHIGMAAVQVLDACGYDVVLPEGRACCGRPAFSMGRLDVAASFGKRNLALLKDSTEPILFLEPSCYSMFKEDYRELKLDGAEAMSERVFLFEQFMDKVLSERPESLALDGPPRQIAIHAHCHAKALTDTKIMPRLASHVPNNQVTMLDTGCCGMAGAFGALEDKYELSLAVGRDLIKKINAMGPDAVVVASGASCRHQVQHLSEIKPLHMAELLAQALKKD